MIPDLYLRPLLHGRIRERIADFQVTEQLGFEPDGRNTHELLYIEKRDTNTLWLARQIARYAGVEAREVGYSGLKDRRAVTRQWFSVPHKPGVNWSVFELEGMSVLRAEGHSRKLRIGSHRQNSFCITVRCDAEIDAAAVRERVATVCEHGVPNAFGAQRFGHNNLDLARSLFAGKRLRRDKRSIAISAARSQIFNAILDARIAANTWRHIVPGELANLAGSNSVFSVSDVDDTLASRCRALDIHPSGPLWGEGAPSAASPLAEFEREVAGRHQDLADGLVGLKVKPAQRALRMQAHDLQAEVTQETCVLRFSLDRGCYATSLLDVFGQIEAVRADAVD